jgi:segregation and condensation protein B
MECREDSRLGTDNVKSIIEALLFAGNEPVRPGEILEILASVPPLGDGAIRVFIDELRDEYLKSGRSFTIAEIAGGYRLQTLPEYGDWISKLRAAPSRRKLSAPALETLAIAAYRQPITKAEIEAIRGVNIDGVLENLMDRELIEPKGRKQAIGKPHLYGTTKKFLEHFGLRTIKDLPEIEELKRAAAEQAPQSAVTAPAPAEQKPLT